MNIEKSIKIYQNKKKITVINNEEVLPLNNDEVIYEFEALSKSNKGVKA